MSTTPTEFRGVTAVAKANVFFDGKVVSHTILFPDGSKKSLGIMFPGTFRFNTAAAERMAITAGQCAAKVDGQPATKGYGPGEAFDIPAQSGFDVEVKSGVCEYVCSFFP